MASNSTPSLEELKGLSPLEAIPLLDEIIRQNPANEEAIIMRGLKHWSLNHRREAINDYLAAINLNPDSKAKMLLQYANSVLSYYNKDLLNP